MNRRGFLKLTLFATASVVIPIPKFLLPETAMPFELFKGKADWVEPGRALTVEDVEALAAIAAANHGCPDELWLDEDTYNALVSQIISKGGNALFSWELSCT